MKKFKKFGILILVFLIVLVTILFLPKKIDNKTYYKNLKELNYSVTYKQAFPDDIFRYVVLTCVVDNVCNNVDEELKNTNPDTYNNNSKPYIYFNENRQYYVNKFKDKENEIINKADLDKIKMIYIKSNSYNSILNLRGIEYLTNLVMFYGNYINTPEINLSFNPNIEYLHLRGNDPWNKACDINLGNVTKLKEFQFSISAPSRNINNNVLDFGGNSNLETLTVYSCKYSNFNLTKNYKLKNLNLDSNQINKINLDNNSLLEEINLGHNLIFSFEVNNKYNLKKLFLYMNYINNLNLANMPNLEELNVNLNSLTSLNNLNIVPKIKKLHVGENYIKDIDLSPLSLLEEVYISGSPAKSKINSVNLTNNHNLKNISILSTNISNLNLTNNRILEDLSLSNNSNLNSLNIDNNHNLKRLTLVNNSFNELNLNNNIQLENLIIQNHNLTSINLSNNVKLRYIYLNNNNLSTLNLSSNNLLYELQAKNNNISNIELNSENLYNLDLTNNKISSLNLSNASKLSSVLLNNNKLSTLDLSSSTKLSRLYVNDNLLSKLILPRNNIYDCNNLKYENNKLMEVQNTRCLSKNQNIDIEVIKNKLVAIPIKYAASPTGFYYGLLKENNEVFEKLLWQNYKFKKLGTYTLDFDVYYYIQGVQNHNSFGKGGTVTVTVKPGEEDAYNPVVNNLRTKEGYPSGFTEQTYRNAITNLPSNIKKFEVNINQLDTSTPGIKNIIVKLTFNDDTEKEVVVPVEVEELTKDNYVPTTKTISVSRTTQITDDEYKKMITNLPNNIQKVDIVQRVDTNISGNHEAILNVVLRNGQVKEVRIPIKVSEIMAETFEPIYRESVFYVSDYYSIGYQNIANEPSGAYYRILKDNNEIMTNEEMRDIVKSKGSKNLKIKVFFPDKSSNEYIMPIDVYERITLDVDRIGFRPENEEYIDYNNNRILIEKNRKDIPKDYCNKETYTCYSYYKYPYDYSATNIDGSIEGPKGGIWFEYDNEEFIASPNRFNPGVSLVGQNPWDPSYQNPSWGKDEEKRIVEVYGTHNSESKKVQTITILRDTDRDGIPDEEDLDDDNDGISDEQEKIDGTDSKDKNSYKVTKICYKVNA